MDLAGLNWTLITIVGAVVLAALIAFAALRNRADGDTSGTEEATRRVYEEEEREHHGESDNVP
ncbi:MAG: hypothetical protein ACT4N8_04665 [Sphingosinicella sp.]|uniref:hypothetical protein n=1 Tax=Sphingosinicella sp. TaxID=1917971 RepID=UPI0040376879